MSENRVNTQPPLSLEKMKSYERIWNAGQSWYYECVSRVGSHKVRVKIERNAYDYQSYVRVYVWSISATGWKFLTHIPIENTPAFQLHYVDRPGPLVDTQLKDTARMALQQAKLILEDI